MYTFIYKRIYENLETCAHCNQAVTVVSLNTALQQLDMSVKIQPNK